MADSKDITRQQLIERNISRAKHRMCASPEYHAWEGMKGRCYHPSYKGYARYGGRGIAVCERWLSSFAAFYKDMGPRPSSSHSLDRINNDGNYEPGNCRWATWSEQASNKSSPRRYKNAQVFDGKTLLEWHRITGVPIETIRDRLGRGLPIETAISDPLPQRRHPQKGHFV